MKVMDWLFRREVLTDQEIDLVKVMEIKQEAGRGDVPSIVFEIREHGKHTAVGRCDLRMGMNEELYYAGQIGYTVYPMYRGIITRSKPAGCCFSWRSRNTAWIR